MGPMRRGDQLAERLRKDPVAAGQLMDAMIRKDVIENDFAEWCRGARAQPRIPSEPKEHATGGSQ